MEYIKTDKAPEAIGHYSQAIKTENMLFVSGQIPIDPQTGRIVRDNFKEAANLVIQNLLNIVEAADLTLENVVKVTVYLRDISYFKEFNEIYGNYFSAHKPARVVVEVSNLPKDVDLEIDAICVTK